MARELSISNVCQWIVKHRVSITSYLDLKNHTESPDQQRRVQLHALNDIMEIVNICFKALQGKTKRVNNQTYRIKMCARMHQALVCINYIESKGVDLLRERYLENDGVFRLEDRIISLLWIPGFLEGLCFMSCQLFDDLWSKSRRIYGTDWLCTMRTTSDIWWACGTWRWKMHRFSWNFHHYCLIVWNQTPLDNVF